MVTPMIVCHGGAGHSAKDQPGVDAAADAGWGILSTGGSALDAVLAAVEIMENDPVLNAGTGGRKRADGSVQLDAAVATSDGKLGSIMAIEDTPNPVHVAAGLLNEPYHILVGQGARDWADQQGYPKAKVEGSDSPSGNDTVGSVAIDENGLMAVATSTGGCTGRPRGRVGDTPLWGPGFWIDEEVALAATGIGEDITIKMLCHRVAIQTGTLQQRLEYGISLFDPSIEVGLIGITAKGEALGLANTGLPLAIRSVNQ
ncbi:MAG: isoaspartyl peptidase/L-asparaginase [Candidatus Thalassarchaeaceae archaeon]|jgi:L-asparaginase / beta-aspartyl-peptidase|nr:isoaspartyl peptidase/L-asparaginase [Candidatus Thalassarchaeaceae archaeon]